MIKALQVEIISPQGYLFDGQCHLVSLPSTDGDIGVMSNHESLLARLREGKIAIFDEQQNILKEFPVTSGFAEMLDNKLLVLVD